MYRKTNILTLTFFQFYLNFDSVIINWRLNPKATIPRTSKMVSIDPFYSNTLIQVESEIVYWIMCHKIEKTKWPFFFIRCSAAFPSVLYSSSLCCYKKKRRPRCTTSIFRHKYILVENL